MSRYKLYATTNDAIAESVVWLKKDLGRRPRCVVKITNTENGRSVFCEALQFDQNFLSLYNQCPSQRMPIENPEFSIVMSYWYRARLGSKEALETQTEYPLEIAPANGWYGKLRASMNHPQVGVRAAVGLGILSVVFGLVGAALGIISVLPVRGSTTTATTASFSALSVNGVLAWRGTYGDLLEKSREAVIERFGTPNGEDGTILSWNEALKTGNRPLLVGFDSANKDSIVQIVKVGARQTEWLDAVEVFKKAPMFTFSTGTYKDALLNYFTAETKDGRNVFQFDVTERGLKFRYVSFVKK
jgi:hypothetical protein